MGIFRMVENEELGTLKKPFELSNVKVSELPKIPVSLNWISLSDPAGRVNRPPI